MFSVPPIDLSFENLKVWVSRKEGYIPGRRITKNKMILNGISGSFKSGTSTAILGPSGSGKTSLLNYLTGRIKQSNIHFNGQLKVNGHLVPTIYDYKHRLSYVLQDDLLYEAQTVRQHIYSQAVISGVQGATIATDNLIKWLGLEKCQHTRIKGNISGGEKKRTSIATEIVTNPSAVFMDEPTTGLDSKSALNLVALLQMMAKNGRTLVSTIHQPSAEVLQMFDRVIVMCKGNIVYDGPPEYIEYHFNSIGFQAPILTNPADHLMAVLNEDNILAQAHQAGLDMTREELKESFSKRVELLVTANQIRNKKRDFEKIETFF